MLSDSIVMFLSGLPHFQHDEINERLVATRLTDGTVYLSPSDLGEQERGLLLVRWQGDPSRETMTIGTQIASLEIVEAVKHWIAIGEEQNVQEAVKFMFQHFQAKTGESLYLFEDNARLPKTLEPLIKDLGLSAIKKLIGL